MKIQVFIVLILLMLSCRKTEFTCTGSDIEVLKNKNFEQNNLPTNFENKVFIINEGGFTNGNASISAFDVNSNTLENNIFEQVNNYPLGDVVQSITRQNDMLYIVVNNSQKIEIVKENTFERYQTIIGLSSPRYLNFADETKFLVTDLYENNIKVLDTEQNCNVKNIVTEGWTEEIFKIGNFFWLIERNGIGDNEKFANLLKINAANFEVALRIGIPVEPNSIALDNSNNIWILSSGIEAQNKPPQLIKVNTSNSQVEKTFTFNSFTNIAQNLVYNKLNNSFYYSKAEFIYKLPATASELSDQAAFQTDATIIYNLAIHPESQDLYISDALDYVSKGKVFIYSSTGNLKNELDVGYLPSKILF